jgi:tetratricopeptide (TPR) repeat protein
MRTCHPSAIVNRTSPIRSGSPFFPFPLFRFSPLALLCLLAFGSVSDAAGSPAQHDLPEALSRVFEAGVAAEKAGRLDEAEKDFQQVLRGGANLAIVHNNLGTVYQQRGDHARAIAQFRAAIRLQPDYLAPHILLGASLLATNKVPEAVRELERAMTLGPREPLVRVELAKAYERANNLTGVVEQYRALRELAPHEPEYVYQIGQAYLKLSQWCLEQIKRLDPQSARIDESLAEDYRAQGRMDEAIRAFQRAAQADPKLPGIHLALAQIYVAQSRTEDAAHEIALELALVPESLAAKAVQEKIASEQTRARP